MGFYQEVTTRYGAGTTAQLKTWSSNNMKLASAVNRRVFLLECKRKNVIPKHICANIKNIQRLFEMDAGAKFNRRLQRFNDRLVMTILRLEISHTNYKINILNKSKKTIMRQISEVLPGEIVEEFKKRQRECYIRQFNRIKQINIGKIGRLHGYGDAIIKTQDRWFMNLTDLNIPENIVTTLSLGRKFSIPVSTKDIPIKKLIADVEDIVEKIPENRRDVLRNRATSIITNHLHKNQNITFKTDKMYKETKKFLRENEDVIILDSDKGSVTVMMNKEEYQQKMNTIVEQDCFRKLNRDPTSTVQNGSNQLISELLENNHIDLQMAKKMKRYNSNCPKIYGNPKVHKENIPLRPIVASLLSPTLNIAKFLADILKTAYNTDNIYYIKDSITFAGNINGKTVPRDHVLISLDVTNLFGNVYKELIMKVLELKWNIIDQHTTIPKETFLKLVTFVIDNNYFSFEGSYYLQTFGCAMGSKLSPILSQYVMDHILDECIGRLPFRLDFVKKYVDDLIMSVPGSEVETVLQTFNSYDTHIKFTIEYEDENCSVPFLDTRVCRMNDEIRLDWYRKGTSSNKLIHYLSEHSVKIKINCIKEMKNRIHKICHPTFIDKNIRRLYTIFSENGYPSYMLKKLLFESSTLSPDQNSLSHPPDVGNDSEPPVYVGLPNIHDLTSKIKMLFKDENVKIATYNMKTLSTLYSKLKDPVPQTLQSNVIYKIPCADCEGTYVGQTSQWLKSRITLHRSDIKKNNTRCALASHAISKKHNIDYGNVEILDTANKYNKRKILEMIYIKNQKHPLNRKTDVQDLSNIYSYLLSYSTSDMCDGPLDE